MRVGHRVGMVLFALLAIALGESGPLARQAAWQPSPGHTQLPIWPGVVPDARPLDGPEVSGIVVDAVGHQRLVGGKPWVYVHNVSQPTMTVYSPHGPNTGAAVVVFPGGGYNVLAIDLEGTEACDWLTSRGITCVLLKYRVPCVKVGPYRDCPTALEDAQRTVGLVRFQAARWHVDPRKIGVLGFSAGGHMVAAMSSHFEKRLYPFGNHRRTDSPRMSGVLASRKRTSSYAALKPDDSKGLAELHSDVAEMTTFGEPPLVMKLEALAVAG